MQNNEQQQHPAQYNEQLRMRNDIETFYAESLYGSMRTPTLYDYDSVAVELYAEDGGALGRVFDDAVLDMQVRVTSYPEFSFELRRRQQEQSEYEDMLNMMDDEKVNTIVVVSDFPEELWDAEHSVGGYDVHRKQTYLRVLVKDSDRLYMYSQSLDCSDRQGLEKIYVDLGNDAAPGELLGQRIKLQIDNQEQHLLVDRLTASYDNVLLQKTGVVHQAGIAMQDAHPIDSYAFVKEQKDIIGFSMTMQSYGSLTLDKQYDMMALLRERYETARSGTLDFRHYASNNMGSIVLQQSMIELHAQQAGEKAKSEGRTFNGCGITMRPTSQPSSEDKLDAAGYSSANKETGAEDKFGPLEFKCQKGHWNRRPRNRLIDNCKTCNVAVGCGKKPTKK